MKVKHLCAVAIAAIALIAAGAYGAGPYGLGYGQIDHTTNLTGSGSFDVAGNWNNGAPNATAQANISGNLSATVTVAGGGTAGYVVVGASGGASVSGSLTIEAGATLDIVDVMYSGPGDYEYHSLDIGVGATGSVTLEAGATVNTAGDVAIGKGPTWTAGFDAILTLQAGEPRIVGDRLVVGRLDDRHFLFVNLVLVDADEVGGLLPDGDGAELLAVAVRQYTIPTQAVSNWRVQRISMAADAHVPVDPLEVAVDRHQHLGLHPAVAPLGDNVAVEEVEGEVAGLVDVLHPQVLDGASVERAAVGDEIRRGAVDHFVGELALGPHCRGEDEMVDRGADVHRLAVAGRAELLVSGGGGAVATFHVAGAGSGYGHLYDTPPSRARNSAIVFSLCRSCISSLTTAQMLTA